MGEIDLYLGKINEKNLHSSDMDLIIKMIREDSKKGHIKSEQDDTEWFDVYKFGLEELELSLEGGSRLRVGDWREKLDFGKVREFVDDMEEKSLISNVSWTLGSVIFYIMNPDIYRIHLFHKIKDHLCRLYSL
jgi:hypothetical protein